MTILEALQALDPAKDDHWTGEGRPAMVAVVDLVGQEVTRREVDAVAPDFTREHRVLPDDPPADPTPNTAHEGHPEAVPDDPITALEQRIAALDTHVNAAIDQRDAANAKIAQRSAERDQLQRQLDRIKPRVDENQQEIRAYLASQKKQTAARGERLRELEAQQPADPRAPIDQAFANRRRGARPIPAPRS